MLSKTTAKIFFIIFSIIIIGCASKQSPQITQPLSQDVNFISQSKSSIDILVIDERPDIEKIPDIGYKTGVAYTAWGPESQCENFATEVGAALIRANAVPAYNNLNKNPSAKSNGLKFTFHIKHWYAKWPMHPEHNPVNVEGLFETTLEISNNESAIYKNEYKTNGRPLFVAMDGVNTANLEAYFHFAEDKLGIKGNNVLHAMVSAVTNDLSKNWANILSAKKI